MDEFVKGKQLYVRVRGEEFPYDAKVTVYVDTSTGNWVVSTPMGTESTADLCAEMLDHFNEILDNPPKEPEREGVVLMPMPSQDFH